MKLFCALLLFSLPAFGQSKPNDALSSMPSKEEISELLSKANEKTIAFEQAVKAAKPFLDRIDPKLVSNGRVNRALSHRYNSEGRPIGV